MKAKQIISYAILLLLVPAAIVLGFLIFGSGGFIYSILAVSVLVCAAFFLSFEKSSHKSGVILILAVMVALSVASRFIPYVNPMSALIIITAMYFGAQAGFITGAMSALVSNFFFSQGPWTPFQMFAWGTIGFIAGLLCKPLKKSKILLALFGAFSGILFSLFMDVLTVLWQDGYFNASRYLAVLYTALPFTALYAVTNTVFLLLLSRPIGNKLDRIKTKYEL